MGRRRGRRLSVYLGRRCLGSIVSEMFYIHGLLVEQNSPPVTRTTFPSRLGMSVEGLNFFAAPILLKSSPKFGPSTSKMKQ